MMRVTNPERRKSQERYEHILSWSVFGTLFSLIFLNWLFNLFDVTYFLFSVILYILFAIGAYVGFRGAQNLGTQNFIGKSQSAYGIMFAVFALSTLLFDYATFFVANNSGLLAIASGLWAFGALTAIVGLDHLLFTRKHTYEAKHSFAGILILLLVTIAVLFITGLPALSNPLHIIIADLSITITYIGLITCAIFTLLIHKEKVMQYASFIAFGLIAFTCSYFFTTYVFLRDILLLGGLTLIILGLHFVQSLYNKKRSN